MKSEICNALAAMICSICFVMQFDPRMLPPDYRLGSSFIWIVLGLAVFDFLLLAGGFYLAALSEERKIRKNEHIDSEDVAQPNAASGELNSRPRKLGTCRGETWIADDFDAPMVRRRSKVETQETVKKLSRC